MANVITNNVDSFLKTTSFTGNTIIDSLIIASIVPIVIAYINSMFGFVKAIFEYVFKTIYSYFEEKIRTRFIGKVVCNITFSEENTLFLHIKDMVFNSDVKSDINDNIFKMICALGNSKTDAEKEIRYCDKFKMSLNYSGDKLFLFNKNYSITNIDTKIFVHKSNYYVKISLQNNSNHNDNKNAQIKENLGNQIVIELITIKQIQVTSDYEYANEIENFLMEKFKIGETITYKYAVKITDRNLNSHVSNFINKGYINSTTGTLKYGDGKFRCELLRVNNDNKNAPPSLLADAKNRNLSYCDDSIKENLVLVNIGNDMIDGLTGFHTLYTKYISKNTGLVSGYGYYCDNNKLIMLSSDGGYGCHYIHIISRAKLLKEDDIKQILQYIILTGMNSTKPVLNALVIKNNVQVYKYSSNSWIAYSLDKRTFDSIFIHNRTMKEIKKELENFIRVEKLYKECNIPYRKGILLYGPPGTGKTSLVKAIAYEYQMNVYMININDSTINDDTIVDMINSIGGQGNKILLFEDIDSAFSEKEEIKFGKKYENDIIDVSDDDNNNKSNNLNKKNDKKNMQFTYGSQQKYLTYSGLINALDGVLSNQHGVITIMTTNYVEKLGDALIRPGRIDHKYKLEACDFEQIVHMTSYIITKSIELIASNNLQNVQIENNYDEDELHSKIEEFASKLVNENKFSKIKPCKLQQYILKNIENIDIIFDNWEELLDDK